MAAWRSRCAEHSSSKRLAWVPARNSAKADWDSPAAKMRSNKTLCDTKRQIVQMSPAPLPAHVSRAACSALIATRNKDFIERGALGLTTDEKTATASYEGACPRVHVVIVFSFSNVSYQCVL